MSLSKGCVLCHQGAKMVLFVTGRCHRTCWYCPLSRERKGTDTVFANEHPVDIPAQIIQEAENMSALGTGITGGEPLLCLDKVTEFCRLLKEHFGPEHQIHLYTAKAPTPGELAQMQGLVDEIRLHPPHENWKEILASDFIASARHAKEMGFDIGIEVPALPGLENLIPALPYLDFLNINELEWGESNAYHMRERGYELADELHNAIEGAKGWAIPVLKTQSHLGVGIDEVVEAIWAHGEFLHHSGEWQKRDEHRLKSELEKLIEQRLMEHWHAGVDDETYQHLLKNMIERKISPYQAVEILVK